MKRITTTAAALAATLSLAAAPAVLLASTAEAANATPGCITKAEFRAVKKGASLKEARKIIGAQGKVTSSSNYSDGDASRTVGFRQCGNSWNASSVSFDFEKTEREVWVSDFYCYDGECEDWGGYETKYVQPFIVTSKYAYWF
jgi:hypothetical protein